MYSWSLLGEGKAKDSSQIVEQTIAVAAEQANYVIYRSSINSYASLFLKILIYELNDW